MSAPKRPTSIHSRVLGRLRSGGELPGKDFGKKAMVLLARKPSYRRSFRSNSAVSISKCCPVVGPTGGHR